MHRRALVGGQQAGLQKPVAANARMDGETLLGVADGLGKEAFEIERAEALRQRLPCLDRAGHGDRQRAACRYGIETLAAKPLGIGRRRRTTRPVEAMERAVWFGQNDEAVAT